MLRRTAVFLLLGALAVAADSLPRAARAQTRVPPINFKERTLPNGLVVYTAQERSSPTVAIQVWYRVGSKDDPDRPQRLRASLRAPHVQEHEEHARRR